MAETQRTKTDLITNLFQDGQAPGEITAEDIRDLIISLTPSIGSMYVSTEVETDVLTAGTFLKAEGLTTFQTGPGHNFLMDTDNTLTYDGTVQRDFLIDVSIASSAVGNNKTLAYRLAKNGVTFPETEMRRESGGAGTFGSVSITFYTHLEKGDTLELWITNVTDNTNITINTMFMNVVGWSA